MLVDDVQDTFLFWYWYLHFYSTLFSWIPFNIGSPNILTHTLFLLFIFGFTFLNSVLFDELFALFLSACSLVFLVLSKLSFSPYLLSATSNLMLISFWGRIGFFFSPSFVWSSDLRMTSFFDSNSKLVRQLSNFSCFLFCF